VDILSPSCLALQENSVLLAHFTPKYLACSLSHNVMGCLMSSSCIARKICQLLYQDAAVTCDFLSFLLLLSPTWCMATTTTKTRRILPPLLVPSPSCELPQDFGFDTGTSHFINRLPPHTPISFIHPIPFAFLLCDAHNCLLYV